MSQYVHSFDDIDFLVRTSTPQQIADKYGVDVAEIESRIANPADLAAYLESVTAQPEEQAEVPAEEAITEFEAEQLDYSYEFAPRGFHVFIRPVDKTHAARMVFPKSHQSDQEIGFIFAVHETVPDLKKGMLVSYDRFAALGSAFNAVDDSGEVCFVVQVPQEAISAVLTRRDL